MAAHEAFDPIWRSGAMSRSRAYQWLADRLGIDREDCHMLNFDETTCLRVVAECQMREFGELARGS